MLPMAGLHTSQPTASLFTPQVSIMLVEVLSFLILRKKLISVSVSQGGQEATRT